MVERYCEYCSAVSYGKRPLHMTQQLTKLQEMPCSLADLFSNSSEYWNIRPASGEALEITNNVRSDLWYYVHPQYWRSERSDEQREEAQKVFKEYFNKTMKSAVTGNRWNGALIGIPQEKAKILLEARRLCRGVYEEFCAMKQLLLERAARANQQSWVLVFSLRVWTELG